MRSPLTIRIFQVEEVDGNSSDHLFRKDQEVETSIVSFLLLIFVGHTFFLKHGFGRNPYDKAS